MKKWYSNISLKTKSILFSIITTTLVAILVTGVSYFVNSKFMLQNLVTDAEQTVETWSQDIDPKDVMEVMESDDESSEAAQRLISHFYLWYRAGKWFRNEFSCFTNRIIRHT